MRTIFPFLLLLFISCNDSKDKPEKEVPIRGSELLGKWQLEATKISPGGPVEWTSVNNGGIYVFEPDGTFTFNDPGDTEFNRSGTYSVEEDELSLSYLRKGENADAVYHMALAGGKLTLQFIGCIEECSERYKPVD